jgi:hypothetical protein
MIDSVTSSEEIGKEEKFKATDVSRGDERESLMAGSVMGSEDVGEAEKSKSIDVLRGETREVEIPGGRGIATPKGGSTIRGMRAGLSLAKNCISSKITWQEIYTQLSLGSRHW